jgi:hypothetical protein
MKKLAFAIPVFAVVMLSACSSAPKQAVQAAPKPVPQVGMAVMGSDGRADIQRTVDNLIDYCEDWAKAYQSRLGKDYVEAYDECIGLTAKMMRDRSKRLIENAERMGEFPFVGG